MIEDAVKGRVSLLLTTYNCADVLPTTLDSIEMQDYSDIEVCIADSCSTDGTLSIIDNFSKRSKHRTVFESKKDSGVHEGVNNAIALSSGEYLQVMNDRFIVPNAVSKLVRSINETDALAISSKDRVIGTHSDLVYADGDRVIRYWHMGQGSIKAGWMPAHPTLMLKREAYNIYGLYDETYKCSGDYEFMLRFLKDGKKLAYVPEVLISMYYGGTSNASAAAYLQSIKEAIQALKTNDIHPALLITLLRTARVALQFISKGSNNTIDSVTNRDIRKPY